jgi:signal transduction histidine kinase
MNNPLRRLSRHLKGRTPAVTLLFLGLGLTLVQLVLGYWLMVLEPRLSADAQSRTHALAQAHAHYLTEVLSGGAGEVTPRALTAAIDEILALRDESSLIPFIRGIVVEVDYDAVQAPAGSLDLRAGDPHCAGCFRVEIFLQHEKSRAHVGIATFFASPHFLQELIADLRERLAWSSLLAATLIFLAWLGVRRLMRRQEESEANLRNVFAAAPFPMILQDSEERRLILSNRAAMSYFATYLDRQGPITDQGWHDLLDGNPGTLLDTAEGEGREVCLWMGSEEPHWALVSSIPLAYFGKPSRLIAFADITPLKQVQAELHRAKEAAEQATRAKSTFLAIMSHEIRTPLNGILGMAQLLSRDTLAPLQRQRVQAIGWAGDALLSLVNDILDFSRIEAGRFQLDPTDFDLAELLEATRAIVEARAQEKGLRLDFQLDPAAVGIYRADGNRIRQVLLNLLGNAVKFTDRGRVSLRVRVIETQAEQATLGFEVSDTGIGIADEVLPKLFQEFTQSDQSIARRFGGSGLGLAISRRLVELMGGEIGVESRLGEGSTFHFQLPLPFGSEPEWALRSAVASGACAGLRLLVVDDVELNRMVLLGLLDDTRHRIHEAEHGQQALERLAEQDYDLIFLDLHMPVMDGFEAARRIRAFNDPRKSGVPIVALTADVTQETLQVCREIGINEVAPKPCPPGELQRLLQQFAPPPG